MVARWQLGAIGLTLSMLKTRVARGSLTRLHRGVYAVGHRQLRLEAHSLAAVLAVGPDAVASHRDAAWLHGLRPGNHRRSDVTTTRRVRSTDRIDVHRTTVLTPADVTIQGGVPVTTVARTLVDLAGVVPRDHLAKAVSEAERLQRFDPRAVEAALDRTRQRSRPGRAAIESVLDEHRAHGLQLDAETLERLLLALVTAHDLPRPLIRHMVDGREVDACWPRALLAVELDGWEFHRHRRAFQRDREKSNVLTAAGWTVLRFTHHDLTQRPAYVAGQLRRVLERS